MDRDEIFAFFITKKALEILPTAILQELIAELTENSEPSGLYILTQGTIESDSLHNKQKLSLLVGSTLNLYALLLQSSTE